MRTFFFKIFIMIYMLVCGLSFSCSVFAMKEDEGFSVEEVVREVEAEELFHQGNESYFAAQLTESDSDKEALYLASTVCYKTAAKQGHADAMFRLGVIYAEGLGVELSDEKAYKWLRRAATRDYKSICDQKKSNDEPQERKEFLGQPLTNYQGIVNKNNIISSLKQLLIQGDKARSAAQKEKNLQTQGTLYTLARYYYEQAAKQDFDVASNIDCSGIKHQELRQSVEETIKKFERWIASGQATAQYNLAVMYAAGCSRDVSRRTWGCKAIK